ncbi:MAG TPA: hypothetical protein VKA19_01355, partial [Alphaproteobacteria bacterium]|nr:hypothetical protein [Alphaproteobacteria bacterium]
NHFIETPDGWEHPTTPWGAPDIQATLDMMQASGVPLRRCTDSYRPGGGPCDMDRVWKSEAEYKKAMEAYEEGGDKWKELLQEGKVSAAMRAVGSNRIPQRQTSLIMDPANGQLPALTEEGKRRALQMGSDWPLPGEDIKFDGVEDFDGWDRCVTRGMPSMMMPYRYNGGFEIIQTPGYVIFNIEMIHEARIIPIGDSPAPLDEGVKQWLGESRGHWEGNTLVVETTNYRDGMSINNVLINLAVRGAPPGNRFPVSDQLKTTERIARLNETTWLYEITVEDPEILTEPFTVRYPMRHDPDYTIFEYACHEDNMIIRDYISADRARRANPEPVPEPTPVEASSEMAEALDGRWIGHPDIITIDQEIEVEFSKTEDGKVIGRLIGTNFGEIDKPLRDFKIDGQTVSFTFPNVDPWNVSAELKEDGTMEGVVFSIQGGRPITFKRASN